MVNIVADFLDALDLTDVTLVVTDWGGALFLTDIGDFYSVYKVWERRLGGGRGRRATRPRAGP